MLCLQYSMPWQYCKYIHILCIYMVHGIKGAVRKLNWHQREKFHPRAIKCRNGTVSTSGKNVWNERKWAYVISQSIFISYTAQHTRTRINLYNKPCVLVMTLLLTFIRSNRLKTERKQMTMLSSANIFHIFPVVAFSFSRTKLHDIVQIIYIVIEMFQLSIRAANQSRLTSKRCIRSNRFTSVNVSGSAYLGSVTSDAIYVI